MNNVYDKLKEMGIVLPSPPPKGEYILLSRNSEGTIYTVPDAVRK